MHLSCRLIISSLLLVAGCLAIDLWSLRSGVVTLETQQIIAALLGDAPRSITLVVTEWRLPRVLMALLIGATLGVSGAVLQSLMRNPLGSPDVMGFNTEAWSGVLMAIVLSRQHLTAIALAAMLDGILASLVVWTLAWRNEIDILQSIIVDIGIRAVLVVFNTWLLLRAPLETAPTTGLWNTELLSDLTQTKTWLSVPLATIMLVCVVLLVRRMRLPEMDGDSVCALGVSVERSRLMTMLAAVVLTAATTMLASPISFTALAAPHIARRTSGTSRWGLTLSASCGVLLLLMADLCA